MRIGIQAEFGTIVILRCQISKIFGAAVRLASIDVGEINECSIHDVGSGISCDGVAGSSKLLVVKNDIRRANGVGSVPELGFAVFAEKFLTVKVIDCSIDSCVGSGIYFRGGNNNPIETAELRGNIISRTNLDGIIGRAPVMHAIIQNNDVSYPGFLGGDSSNGIHCINWLGPNALIEGNHLHHTLDTACISNNCGSGIYIQSSQLLPVTSFIIVL
ncbi:MAG: right-handed parallel beta-helix repeat-containing protein, partial [Lewinellaceae bacterium]|nr:right-handed parallel beta-helix repeat-containing protein [Lewinellaceae bacterium]